MLQNIIANPIGKEVIHCKGDSVFFGLKIRVELYPENLYSVWIILGVRYHNIRK